MAFFYLTKRSNLSSKKNLFVIVVYELLISRSIYLFGLTRQFKPISKASVIVKYTNYLPVIGRGDSGYRITLPYKLDRTTSAARDLALSWTRVSLLFLSRHTLVQVRRAETSVSYCHSISLCIELF